MTLRVPQDDERHPPLRHPADGAAVSQDPSTLTTPNFVLTPFTEADLPRIVEASNSPENQWFLTKIPSPYRLDDARWFVEEFVPAGRSSGDYLTWAVRDAPEGKLLGCIEVRRDQPGDSIGLWVHPDVRGRGVAPEVTSFIAQWAVDNNFTKDGEVYYACMRGNLASLKNAIRSNFTYLGPKNTEGHYQNRLGEDFEYHTMKYLGTPDPASFAQALVEDELTRKPSLDAKIAQWQALRVPQVS